VYFVDDDSLVAYRMVLAGQAIVSVGQTGTVNCFF
jgi:hypothetical protein